LEWRKIDPLSLCRSLSLSLQISDFGLSTIADVEGLTASLSSSQSNPLSGSQSLRKSSVSKNRKESYLRETDVNRDEIEGIMFDLEGYEDVEVDCESTKTVRGEENKVESNSVLGDESGKTRKKVGWCGSVQWRAPETLYEYTDKSDVFRYYSLFSSFSLFQLLVSIEI
jgi:hypothetical protein